MFILSSQLIARPKGSATGCFYSVDDYLFIWCFDFNRNGFKAPGEYLCRFTSITVKTAIRILNTWYLAAKNRTALPAKAKKYPN
jgi:hypothetical protein